MIESLLKNYLEEYVDEMSDSGHADIEGCIRELDKNPRLKGPLVVYCSLLGYPRVIEKLYPCFYQECLFVSYCYRNNVSLPKVYEKVFWSYEAYKMQRNST